MTSRLEEMRANEIALLREALDNAIVRLKVFRKTHPEVDTLDRCYLDGSFRESIGHKTGFITATNHAWSVVALDEPKMDVFILEGVDHEVWRNSGWDREENDTGEYFMGVTSVGEYGGGVYLRGVAREEIHEQKWSLDVIIAITDALTEFYTHEDAVNRVENTIKHLRRSHKAAHLWQPA